MSGALIQRSSDALKEALQAVHAALEAEKKAKATWKDDDGAVFDADRDGENVFAARAIAHESLIRYQARVAERVQAEANQKRIEALIENGEEWIILF